MSTHRYFLYIAVTSVLFLFGCGSSPDPADPVDQPDGSDQKRTSKYTVEEERFARKSIRFYRKGSPGKEAWKEARAKMLEWPDHKGEEFLITFFCASELRPDRPYEEQQRAREEMALLLRGLTKRGAEGAWGLRYFARLLIHADTSFSVTWSNELAPAAGAPLVPYIRELVSVLHERVRTATTEGDRHRWITKMGAALKALGSCGGEQSVPLLGSIYNQYRKSPGEDGWKLRHYATSGLGLSGADAALPVLTRVLDDPERAIQEKAVRAILAYRSKAAVGAMVEVLNRYRHVETMRRSTLSSLRKTAPKDLGPDPDVWIRWYREQEKNR